MLYNSIRFNYQTLRLKPSFNRRKYKLTHYILIKSYISKLSKNFIHISKKKLKYYIGNSLIHYN